MNKSESINELAAALSDFQGEIEDVYKGATGYGYKYADLPNVLAVVRPLLKKNGLAIAQSVSGEPGFTTLTTTLMHRSGQYISSSWTIAIDMSNKKMNSLQAAGSTLSYMRRYKIMALVGLAATDDDGASGGDYIDHDSRPTPITPVTPLPIKEIPESERQNLLIKAIAYSLEGDDTGADIINNALNHYKVPTLEQLNAMQLSRVIDRIEEEKAKNERRT